MKKTMKRFLVPCAAAAFTIGASMISFGAVGWQQEGGVWRYINSGGDYASESWKKSGDDWFWLDSDGEMAVSSLIEDGDDHYYVNSAGSMVKNQWRELDNTDNSDDEADTCWYYFGPNGKAYKAASSGKTTFKTITNGEGITRRYAFDTEGRMLYGWVDEESNRVTDDDAWRTGVYYLGTNGDGSLRSNCWERLEVDDDENDDDDFDGYYWFWFNANGKKLTDTTRTINGRK